jgi:hypothetical protein
MMWQSLVLQATGGAAITRSRSATISQASIFENKAIVHNTKDINVMNEHALATSLDDSRRSPDEIDARKRCNTQQQRMETMESKGCTDQQSAGALNG